MRYIREGREHARREEKEKKGKEEKAREDREAARELLKEFQEQQFSTYEKNYREVSLLIRDLYERLEQILKPQSYPRWEPGYPSGQRLTLKKAKEFSADRSKYKELWERKTRPEKRDYRVTILVDLSSSMFYSGENTPPIQETFKGVVVLTETLEKLGIETEIIGFGTAFPDDVMVFKPFGERLTDEVRNRMALMLKEERSWTPTSTATKFASDRLQEEGGDIKYLVTLTDGLPARESEERGDEQKATREVIGEIRKRTSQRLIGVGLGPNTEHVREYYPASLVTEDIQEFPEQFSGLIEDIISHPAKYQ